MAGMEEKPDNAAADAAKLGDHVAEISAVLTEVSEWLSVKAESGAPLSAKEDRALKEIFSGLRKHLDQLRATNS
jgi:hypothetical protein